MSFEAIRAALQALADPAIAVQSLRFFKCGPGEYGEGDKFLGIRVPALRKLAKVHRDTSLADMRRLLRSPWHEERLLALLLLVHRYQRGDQTVKAQVYDTYRARARYINNWDLVDVSAEHILGAHLAEADQRPLWEMAGSASLWERRMSIMATFHDIKAGRLESTLRIARRLLHDEHDLIHKAVGWMLREIGKRDLACEESFLREHYQSMPRTMLRYAIERFPERRRQAYLKGRV